MFCPSCGAKQDDDAMYCGVCGKPLKRVPAAAQTQKGVEPTVAPKLSSVARVVIPSNISAKAASIDPFRWVLIVIAVLIFILTFFCQWIQSPILKVASGATANGAFSLFGVGGLLESFSAFAGMLSGSSSTGYAGAMISALSSSSGSIKFYMFLWIVAFIVLALGIYRIVTRSDKSVTFLRNSFIFCFILAIAWLIFVASTDTSILTSVVNAMNSGATSNFVSVDQARNMLSESYGMNSVIAVTSWPIVVAVLSGIGAVGSYYISKNH